MLLSKISGTYREQKISIKNYYVIFRNICIKWKRNRCNKRAESIDEITKVAESMASGKSIKEFCKDSKAVNQYENLASEMLAMIS